MPDDEFDADAWAQSIAALPPDERDRVLREFRAEMAHAAAMWKALEQRATVRAGVIEIPLTYK